MYLTRKFILVVITPCTTQIEYHSDRRGGGVALYIKFSIPHEYSDKLTKVSNIEAIRVTIKLPMCAPCNICSLYRSPSANDDYFND